MKTTFFETEFDRRNTRMIRPASFKFSTVSSSDEHEIDLYDQNRLSTIENSDDSNCNEDDKDKGHRTTKQSLFSFTFWQCYFLSNNIQHWLLFVFILLILTIMQLEFDPQPQVLATPEIPPTFEVLDEYCKDTGFSTESAPITWLKNVLSVDYGYRILLFGVVGLIFKYAEKHNVYNIKKHITSNYLRTLCLNFLIIFVLTTIDHYISSKYFGNDVFDDIYNNNSIRTHTNINTGGTGSDIEKEYEFQSERMNGLLWIYQNIGEFFDIFVTVHPKHAIFIRISHALSYPWQIFAVTRRNPSEMCFLYCLQFSTFIFHLGGYAHLIDQGFELKCVRRAFIFKTRAQSVTASALRQVVAPYLNLLCLTVDCSQFRAYD